jgi:glutamyl-tRNA synthetase
MNEWINILTTIHSFEAGEIEKEFKQFLTTKNLGIGAVLPLFRLLVTGVGMGPSMFEIANFLGKDECIQRMHEGLTKLN